MTVSVALHTLEEPTGLHLSCRRCRIRLWWIPIPQLTCASYTTNVPDTSHTRGSSGSRSRSRCIIWICCRGKRLCICKWYFISWYDCGGIYIFALMSLCVCLCDFVSECGIEINTLEQSQSQSQSQSSISNYSTAILLLIT